MLVRTSNLDQRSDIRKQEIKTMFKKIGTTAITLALLAGTLATPAFASSAYGKKISIPNNRSYSESRPGIRHHFGGFKVVGLKTTATRTIDANASDYRLVYNKLNFVSGN